VCGNTAEVGVTWSCEPKNAGGPWELENAKEWILPQDFL
jgi:hypothetical protein